MSVVGLHAHLFSSFDLSEHDPVPPPPDVVGEGDVAAPVVGVVVVPPVDLVQQNGFTGLAAVHAVFPSAFAFGKLAVSEQLEY